MNKELIRLKEISDIIGLSTSTLRKMIKRKELKGVKVGGNYYVRPNDYYEFIFNIECKKLGVTPEIVKKFIEKEEREKQNYLLKQLGVDNLDKNSQDLIMAAMSYSR